jgi:hypothetical protein
MSGKLITVQVQLDEFEMICEVDSYTDIYPKVAKKYFEYLSKIKFPPCLLCEKDMSDETKSMDNKPPIHMHCLADYILRKGFCSNDFETLVIVLPSLIASIKQLPIVLPVKLSMLMPDICSLKAIINMKKAFRGPIASNYKGDYYDDNCLLCLESMNQESVIEGMELVWCDTCDVPIHSKCYIYRLMKTGDMSCLNCKSELMNYAFGRFLWRLF